MQRFRIVTPVRAGRRTSTRVISASSSNTFRGSLGAAFFIGTGQLHNGDNFSGTFNNNTIGVAGIADSGSTTGNALFEAYDLDNTAGSKFGNISTRGFVQTGNNVMIAGVVVHGPGNKTVLIRALGPTLGQPPFNVPSSLPDPFLDLRDPNGTRITANDNWKSTQQTQIQATGLAPPDDAESAIATTLAPASYTAIVTGVNNTTGNALVEVYGLN